MPESLKGTARIVPSSVKRAFVQQSQANASKPLPTPQTEKKKRPLSVLATNLFQKSEHSRSRGQTVSVAPTPRPLSPQKSASRQRPMSVMSGMHSDRGLKGLFKPVTPVTASEVSFGPVLLSAPLDFINILEERPWQAIEPISLHRLRTLLRTERMAWIETFLEKGGLLAMVGLFNEIFELEYK